MRLIRKILCSCVMLASLAPSALAADPDLNSATVNELLAKTAAQVITVLEQFSDTKCTERVEQEKLGPEGKVLIREDSTYDYLAILSETGGELSLQESRIAVHEAKGNNNKHAPMLLSNGFATLFLIFHPSYSASFRFTYNGQVLRGGKPFANLAFAHVQGTKSPAALALRGREYPLELSGEALIDTETGAIAQIQASIGDSLQDVGLKALRAEVSFAPTPFGKGKASWLPTVASVDVETPRQHWRNRHQFTDYKQFSVGTQEQVAKK